MMLRNNSEIEQLPKFQGGSYSGSDRIYLPHENIYLSSVEILNNGRLKLVARPVDGGAEQWTDFLKLGDPDPEKTEIIHNWLEEKVGDDIHSIFNSEFNFGNTD